MKNSEKVIIAVLLVLIVVIGISLLVWPPSQGMQDKTGAVIKSQPTTPIKLGVSLPFSGEAASYGQGMVGGAELAVEEINAKGGVNGRKIILVKEDDQCNSKGGVAAMNKLIMVSKVDAVIGPLCSAAGGASLPVAQASKTPVIFWGSAPKLPTLGDYVFRTYPSDSFQGKYAAELLYDDFGKRKVAVLYVQNDWGQGLRNVFVERFKELGGEVVFDEGVAQDSKDFRSVMTKMAASKPDAVYLPQYPATYVNSLKQIKELGIDAMLMGGDSSDSDEVTKSGYAEGLIFTAAKIGNPDDFKAKVTARTGKPTNIFTSLTYDSVYIFADVMGRVGTDKTAVRDELVRLSYTKGITLPQISFDSDGDLDSAVFSIKEVKNGQTVEYTD